MLYFPERKMVLIQFLSLFARVFVSTSILDICETETTKISKWVRSLLLGRCRALLRVNLIAKLQYFQPPLQTATSAWHRYILVDSNIGNRDVAVVKALASHQCGPGSIPGSGVTWGLSLLLVLVLAQRVLNDSTGAMAPTTRFTFHEHKKGKKRRGPLSLALLGVQSSRSDKPGVYQDSVLVAFNQFTVVIARLISLVFFVLFFCFCFFHNINPLAERNLACLVCEGRTVGVLYDCICNNRIPQFAVTVPVVKASVLKQSTWHPSVRMSLRSVYRNKDPFTCSIWRHLHTRRSSIFQTSSTLNNRLTVPCSKVCAFVP